MRIVRLVCFGYAVLLTVLLLVPDPAATVGLRRAPSLPWGDIGIHFTCFAALTVLVHRSRRPERSGWLALLVLLGYGMATESLQAFVPQRAVELKDYGENIAGIVVGSAIFWLGQRAARRVREAPKPAAELVRTATAADATAP